MEIATYRQIIASHLASRIESNKRYSMRAFAKSLRVPVSALSEILNSKRVPSFKLASKIALGLNLPPDEQNLFMSSVAQTHRAQPNRQRIGKGFSVEGAGPAPRDLSLDQFRVMSEWYHYAILFLTEVDDFKNDVAWIAKKLGLSQSEAKLAIDRLLSLGMLTIKRGRLQATQKSFTTADKHITTPALRRHIKQILEKAAYSLENDPIENRSMTGMTFAIDPERMPKAKVMIEQFTQKLARYLEGGKKKKVYEISINLFPLMKD